MYRNSLALSRVEGFKEGLEVPSGRAVPRDFAGRRSDKGACAEASLPFGLRHFGVYF